MYIDLEEVTYVSITIIYGLYEIVTFLLKQLLTIAKIMILIETRLTIHCYDYWIFSFYF